MSKATNVRIKVQPTVVMESEVARKIRQHSRSSMKAEVCGVLIGSSENDRIAVDACIPGVNAAQGGAHVTFTQDTWEHIYKIKDKEYPDDKIVGWYHSHPGFGVFLSEHDLFIQENFFSSPQQIAWVYDPHTDEEGCFGWVNGRIDKLSGVRFGYLQSVEVGSAAAGEEGDDENASEAVAGERPRSQDTEPAFVRWTFKAMTYVSIMIMGFVLGFLYVHYQVDPVLRECEDLLRHVVPVMPGANAPQLDDAPPSQGPKSNSPGGQKPGKGNDGRH
jgi:proteasome lid subunit RPN8/RPN11